MACQITVQTLMQQARALLPTPNAPECPAAHTARDTQKARHRSWALGQHRRCVPPQLLQVDAVQEEDIAQPDLSPCLGLRGPLIINSV